MSTKLETILEKVNPSNAKSVQEAANLVLLEAESSGTNRVSVGDTVAMQDDPTYPQGSVGKVKSIDASTGYAVVEWANGTTVNAMLSLLYPVKS